MFLSGCTGVPDATAKAHGDSGFVPAVQIGETELPHKSAVCGPDEQELDGECISDEKALEVIEHASDVALEQMIKQKDPEAQVEAQQVLTKIQEQRVEQAVENTEKIKKLIRDKKKAGKPLKYPKEAFKDFEDYGKQRTPKQEHRG